MASGGLPPLPHNDQRGQPTWPRWDLSKYGLAVAAFYGLPGLRRSGHGGRSFPRDLQTSDFPTDTIRFVAELGDVPILMNRPVKKTTPSRTSICLQ